MSRIAYSIYDKMHLTPTYTADNKESTNWIPTNNYVYKGRI